MPGALRVAAGRVLTREFLVNRVRGYERADEIKSRTVDVHVRRLRAKLGEEGRATSCFLTACRHRERVGSRS